MAKYLAVHVWEKEDFATVGKKVIEGMPGLPEGVILRSSHCDARKTGAWCLYELDRPEVLEEFWAEQVPEMKTELIPVIQFFPPSEDLYKMMHAMAE